MRRPSRNRRAPGRVSAGSPSVARMHAGEFTPTPSAARQYLFTRETAEHQRFKAGSDRLLRICIVVAVAAHVAVFTLWPRYGPWGYKYGAVVLQLVDLATDDQAAIPSRKVDEAEMEPEFEVSDDDNGLEASCTYQVSPPAAARSSVPLGEQSLLSMVNGRPRLLKSVMPVYPDMARFIGIEGKVVVWVLIDNTGHVVHAEVVESDSVVLERPALEAAYGFLFSPAMLHGKPVSVTISIPFRFSLRD
jgi:TonB family protein